jgi:hypothetical protein
MKNVVYFTLTQDVTNRTQTNMENRWGFGDILRGVNNVHSVCMDLGCDLRLLSMNHPLNNVLRLGDENLDELVVTDIEFINFPNRQAMKTHIIQLVQNKQRPIIFTNGFGLWDYTHLKTFKQFIKPKLEFKTARVAKFETMQHLPAYDVLHVRLGDEALFQNNSTFPGNLIKFIDRVRKPTVLISDCLQFKDFCRNFPLVRVSNNHVVHTGVSSSTDELAQTMRDYFFLSNAQKIYPYSTYSWPSGFAKSASIIYDVPLIDLKKTSLLRLMVEGQLKWRK